MVSTEALVSLSSCKRRLSRPISQPFERTKAPIADGLGLSSRHPVVHLSTGMAAETVSAVFWVPMEVVKQRAQVRGDSSLKVAGDLLRQEGPRAFLKGYAVTFGVFGPYSCSIS